MRKRVGDSLAEQKEEQKKFKQLLVRETSVKEVNYPTKEEGLQMLACPFKNDRERIKYYSQKFKDASFDEAFEEVYGVKARRKATLAPIANVNVNDLIKMTITNVTRDGAEYDSTNIKYDVKFSCDLWKMPKFQSCSYPVDLDMMVIAKDKNTITVDPLAGIYKSFLDSYDKDGLAAQYNVKSPKSVRIKGLKLVSGGYVGNLVVPSLSKFTGKDTTIKAFIPGSQIVQNIESDFDKWVGKDVEAFVTTVVNPENQNPMQRGISVICSRKNLINHYGNMNIVQIFKDYTENNDAWKKVQNTTYDGIVTGVINSSKKCGVFVEVPALNITQLVKKAPDTLVNFKKGQKLSVKLNSFDEPTIQGAFGQTEHLLPYVIEDDVLLKVDVKPVFNIL